MEDNSLLERLVEHILLELFEAQKASNKASAKLAQEYLSNQDNQGAEELFPIPNSCIKSFDFSLKFLLKDIGIILTDDAILEINRLLVESWHDLLNSLYEKKAITNPEKEKLLEKTPIPDFKKFKFVSDELDYKTIAETIEQSVISVFVKNISGLKRESKAILTEAVLNLELKKKLNEVIMQSKEEQAIPLSKIQATFDLNKFTDLSEEVVCNINVNVVMRHFDAAYVSETSGGDSNQISRKLLALK